MIKDVLRGDIGYNGVVTTDGMQMDAINVNFGDTQIYGVNYSAALITVFGGSTPAGKLPVDLPEYVEGVGYTDEIVFPIGYGLTF